MARPEQNRALMPMYVGTKMLRNRRIRLSEFGGMQLPRAVDALTLVCTLGGAVLMIVAALILGGGVQVALWAGAIGGGGGYFFATWEPMPNHSLWQYLNLVRKSKRSRQVMWQGKRARVAIGISPVSEAPRGHTQIVAGSVNFDPSNVDPAIFQRKPTDGAGLHAWLEVEPGEVAERMAGRKEMANQVRGRAR